MSKPDLREEVRAHYARAALCLTDHTDQPETSRRDGTSCCGPARGTATSCCGGGLETDATFGAGLYSAAEQGALPVAAVAASLDCGNPMLVAELREGETVLDLGSGGGIDVLLSARRVGERGFVYGVDMTDEMLTLARANAATAGAENVEFVRGVIEDLPLPDAAVDVVISNCVINLSPDNPPCCPRCTGCCGLGAGSASPTWWPRTA